MNWRTLLGEPIRRNHALEHATIAVLQQRDPRVRVVARSSSRGFRVFGTADESEVQAAVAEALARLRSGERELAITQRCGTTVAVGVLVGTLGLWLNDFVRSPRQKLLLALGTCLAIAVSSQPVGLLAQRHITTESRLGDLRVHAIRRRTLGRNNLLDVRTSQQP